MRNDVIKVFAIILFAVPLALFFVFRPAPVIAGTSAGDSAVDYKAKCAACHTPGATKFFDPAKADDEHVQAILKGRKGEKPPFMPAYGDKGITEDGAKALVHHMKELRKAN